MIAPDELASRVKAADLRYGPFASTHEMLGVAYEEWTELCDEVRANRVFAVREECLDLAAVLLRFVHQMDCGNKSMMERSVK